MQLNFLVIFQV